MDSPRWTNTRLLASAIVAGALLLAATPRAASNAPPYVAPDSSWAVSNIWPGEVFFGKYLDYKMNCPRCIEIAVANGLLKGFYYIDRRYGEELGRERWDEEFLALGVKIADGVEILWDSDTRIVLYFASGEDTVAVESMGWVITRNRQAEVYASDQVVAPVRLSDDAGFDATKKSKSIVVFTWFGDRLKDLDVENIVRCEVDNVLSEGWGKLAFRAKK